MIDPLDTIMAIMGESFDPVWGEAWNRAQVASSMDMPTTHLALLTADCLPPTSRNPAVCFALTRAAPGEEELLLIAVHPDHRKNGLGTRLLALLAEDARSRGAERLFLEMRENNPAASLYRSVGYKPIGRRRAYYKLSDGSRLDAITFAKKL